MLTEERIIPNLRKRTTTTARGEHRRHHTGGTSWDDCKKALHFGGNVGGTQRQLPNWKETSSAGGHGRTQPVATTGGRDCQYGERIIFLPRSAEKASRERRRQKRRFTSGTISRRELCLRDRDRSSKELGRRIGIHIEENAFVHAK